MKRAWGGFMVRKMMSDESYDVLNLSEKKHTSQQLYAHIKVNIQDIDPVLFASYHLTPSDNFHMRYVYDIIHYCTLYC